MTTEHRAICEAIARHYGKKAQTIKAVEECAELSAALCHLHFGREKEAELLDELADAAIMVEQLAWFFGRQRVEARIDAKLKRQLSRMRGAEDKP